MHDIEDIQFFGASASPNIANTPIDNFIYAITRN